METNKLHDLFQKKYDEFITELKSSFPEKTDLLEKSEQTTYDERIKLFFEMVKIKPVNEMPEFILPGFTIDEETWNKLSDTNKKAIWDYIKLLYMCCIFDKDCSHSETDKDWIKNSLSEWSRKLGSVDFDSLIKKFTSLFQNKTEEASGNSLPFPTLPQKLLKGQLAKLAEEIVKAIKPEELGLTKEVLNECEKSPSKAFDILIRVVSENPQIIESTIRRIAKSLQKKVESGQFKPQEIAREAEELIKEFSNMPEFVEIMTNIKSTFGFEDLETARKVGKEGSARLSIVQQRLRKKLEMKKNNKGR